MDHLLWRLWNSTQCCLQRVTVWAPGRAAQTINYFFVPSRCCFCWQHCQSGELWCGLCNLRNESSMLSQTDKAMLFFILLPENRSVVENNHPSSRPPNSWRLTVCDSLPVLGLVRSVDMEFRAGTHWRCYHSCLETKNPVTFRKDSQPRGFVLFGRFDVIWPIISTDPLGLLTKQNRLETGMMITGRKR